MIALQSHLTQYWLMSTTSITRGWWINYSLSATCKTSQTWFNIVDCNDVWTTDEHYVQGVMWNARLQITTGRQHLLAGMSRSAHCRIRSTLDPLHLYEMWHPPPNMALRTLPFSARFWGWRDRSNLAVLRLWTQRSSTYPHKILRRAKVKQQWLRIWSSKKTEIEIHISEKHFPCFRWAI